MEFKLVMKLKQFVNLYRFQAVNRAAALLGRDRIADGIKNLMVMGPEFIRHDILARSSCDLFEMFSRKVSTYEIASVHGAVRPFETKLLFCLCMAMRPRKVLEVGTSIGYSTTFLAGALEASRQSHPDHNGNRPILTTVDIIDVNEAPAAPWRRAGFSYGPAEVLRKLSLSEFVHFYTGAANRFFARNDAAFDLIFIDGEHSYAAALNDIGHALECVAPGGIIALHDYQGPGSPPFVEGKPMPGVHQAVQYLTARYPFLETLPLQSAAAVAGIVDGQPQTSLALLSRKS